MAEQKEKPSEPTNPKVPTKTGPPVYQTGNISKIKKPKSEK